MTLRKILLRRKNVGFSHSLDQGHRTLTPMLALGEIYPNPELGTEQQVAVLDPAEGESLGVSCVEHDSDSRPSSRPRGP